MCNVAVSFNGVFNNDNHFLKVGDKIALQQINFVKKIKDSNLLVNIYCNCLHIDSSNPFSILRSITCREQKLEHNYIFYDDLVFFKIANFQNIVKISLNENFKINLCTLIILKNE